MSDLITRTARLVPYAKRPKQVPSFVTAYSYEPLANEFGAKLGSLYVVMEVLVSGRASQEVADLIIETIGERYYNDPHAENSEPLTRFEAAIKAANQELSEHVNRGNAAWIGKLSAVVAVQVGSELHVAQTGSAEAFLYRGKSTTHITPTTPNRPATPAKTFSSIATGQLEPGDRLLLATPALIHQVPLTRLQHVLSEVSPNTAIAEITQLLHGAPADRIAALVIEVTTPELAALQIRSEEPSEIQLGVPDTPIEAAKMMAAPLAQTSLTSSKKVVTFLRTTLKRFRPHLKALALYAANQLRQILSTKAGRRRSLIIGALILAATLGLLWHQYQAAASTKLFNQYQQVYQQFQAGEQLLNTGNKLDAHQAFEQAKTRLAQFKNQEGLINNRLKHAALPEGEPRTVNGLALLITDRLDQIDGLVKVDPITVASITSRNAKLTQLQLVGNNAYVFDKGNHNLLSIINAATGTLKTSSADMSKLGNIVDTTTSNNNDGLYILTDKPSIWFYRFDNDSLTEQTVAFGQWPKAAAVASYTTNLYLLTDTAIYKHVKNTTGFSPKSEYLSLSNHEELNHTSALAIDGAVYLLSPTGLHRYLGGVAKESAPIPSTLSGATNLRITPASTDIIVATDTQTHRIGVWTFKNESLSFSKQVTPNSIKSLFDAVYDIKTGSLYALADNRLVRIPIQP